MDSIIVAPPAVRLPDPPAPPAPGGETADLLRQLLDVQREQLVALRHQQTSQDEKARWRAFVGRHAEQFADLPAGCRRALPAVERVYLRLTAELIDRLDGDDPADLDSEFAVAELLDRYAGRLTQLGQVLGLVGHLAAVAPSDPD